MATTKPKTAATKKKTTAAKPKTTTAAKKTTAKKVVKKPVATSENTKTVDKKVEKPVIASEPATKKENVFKGFFSKKYEGNEGILTIFKNPKLYGALIGEVLGVMFLTLVLFALSLMGVANVALYAFAIIAIYVGAHALSGAHLNPIITVGMMATRRVSVIRGVLYIIAQIIGAWFGWLIFNAFYVAGGTTAYAEVPAMAPVAEGSFWIVTLIEALGAAIIGYFYARSTTVKRSAFTSAAIVAGGICTAVLIGYVVSAAFVNLQNNFIFNPAIALMYQIFPTAGETFGEVFGGICSALATYALFPMLFGTIGFYISDFASKLAGEE